jgi:serine/threonine protein phosphatase PrpC
VNVKPFLTPEPEVLILDVQNVDVTDNDVLVLGTDGLWDITSNNKCADIVTKNLGQFPDTDQVRYRYR